MTRPTEPASAAVPRILATTAAFILLTGIAPLVALAAQPQSQPATRPDNADVPDDAAKTLIDEASIAKVFGDLADPDAEVREAARTRLMGMERRFLPALEKVVAKSRPLLPAQAVALRQIVTHVYCAGETYEADVEHGFLGVRLQPTAISAKAAADAAAAVAAVEIRGLFDPIPAEPLEVPVGDARQQLTGILIVDRLPGFVGSRALRTGDVVLGIVEIPDLEIDPDGATFRFAISKITPNQKIHLQVLRRGRLIKLPIAPDPRPRLADAPGIDPMLQLDQQRREKANEYWRGSFAKLLTEGVG